MENQIIKVDSATELKYLYGRSAMTWEGFDVDEGNLQAMIDRCASKKNADIYVIDGAYMNEAFGLTGDNAYRPDLHIVAIVHYKGLAMPYGARRFDDIVDGNAGRGGKTIGEIE